jgi:autotransporter family porin
VIASTSRPNRLPRSGRARRTSRVRRLGRLARLSRRNVPLVVAAVAMAVALAGGSALALSGAVHKESRRASHPVPVRVAGQPDGRPNGGSGTETGSGLGPATATAAGPATATGPAGAASRAPAAPGQPAPKRFTLVAPGGSLPSGAQCAQWVRAAPSAETRPANAAANQRTGHRIDAARYSTTDARANQRIAPRVDGQFTGSTRDILRWAACKWGFDEDFVYAQAAVESWWRQSTFGDWTTDASRCAPGHGLGADGRPGECPESFGIVQTRYPYMTYGWPGIGQSTAMGADLGYANLRACFEGYEGWLNGVEKGRQYGPGDVWGCAGRYMSGRWYTAAGNDYVAKVRTYLGQRIWETTDFRQS